MIVARSPFVLAAAGTMADLKLPRIGWQTWTRGAAASQVTSSGDSADGPNDRALRPDTFSFWEPPSLPATWQFDFGEIKERVNYVGMLGSFGSKRCAVTCEMSVDGLTWTQFSDDVMPADDAPLLFLDDDVARKHVRVTLEGANAPRMAALYVGTVLVMPYSLYGGISPLKLSRETELTQTMSRSGQFLGQNIRRMGVSGSVPFKNLTAAWYRANFDPFVAAARRYPYFFAWRPSTFPGDVGYVWTPSDIRPSNQGKRDLMSVSVPMEGVGNE